MDEQLSRALYVPDGPWSPYMVGPQPGVRVHVYPPVKEDPFGQVAHIEVPIPTGPIQVEFKVSDGLSVERVEWLYPEMPPDPGSRNDRGAGLLHNPLLDCVRPACAASACALKAHRNRRGLNALYLIKKWVESQ